MKNLCAEDPMSTKNSTIYEDQRSKCKSGNFQTIMIKLKENTSDNQIGNTVLGNTPKA